MSAEVTWTMPIPRFALRLAIIVAIVVSGRSVLADHYHVPTGSMEPTVEVGDRIVVNKAAYGLRVPLVDYYFIRFDAPQRGDVVVLSSPVDDETLLKRVVAVPGDRVQVRAGRLFINGRSTATPVGDYSTASVTPSGSIEWLNGKPHPLSLLSGGGPDLASSHVPDGHFLVMGDNRGDSLDGRQFGWVKRDVITGQALGIYYSADEGFTWRPL